MEKKYDVFISCKSEDYGYAEEVYNFLNSNGIRTFLASKELRKMAITEYRKAIMQVLESAYHLIIFASVPEYIDSKWVFYEWDTFVHAKLNGRKDGQIMTILKGFNTDKLRLDLIKYESFNFDNYKERLLSYVETPDSRRKKEEQKREEESFRQQAAIEAQKRIEEEKLARIREEEYKKALAEADARRKVHEEDIKRIQETERRAREDELARIRRREEDERFRKEAEEKARSKAAEMARKAKEADKQNKQGQQRNNYKNYGNAVQYIFWAVVLIGGVLGWYCLNFGNDSEDVDHLVVEQVQESQVEQAISGTDNYDYVDLGLSVMWATKNIGAVNLYSLGDRFVFGSTTPCVSDLHDECPPFQDNIADKHLLGKEEDAAYKLVGEKWRIPTQGEFEELLEKCSWKKVTLNECGGFLVTGVNGNSIFLPYQEYWLRDFMSHISAPGGPSVEIATFSGGDDKFHIGLYDASHEFRTAHIRPVRMK